MAATIGIGLASLTSDSILLACPVYQVKDHLRRKTQRYPHGKGATGLPGKKTVAHTRIELAPKNEVYGTERLSKPKATSKRLRHKIPDLLADLYNYQSEDTPKSTLFAYDQLSLNLDARRVTRFRGIDGLRRIYDLTSLLLARLSTFAKAKGNLEWPSEAWTSILDKFEHCKDVVNLSQFLKNLQRAALESFIHHGLEYPIEGGQDWHQHWLQKQKKFEIFSEWPNSRRPLSTTWPWNIRPSLVVLWGVCWMFYDNSTRSVQELRQQLEDERIASSVWTRLTPQSATPSQPGNRSRWATGNNDVLNQEPAWLGVSGGVNARRASGALEYSPPLPGYHSTHPTIFNPYISSYTAVSSNPSPDAPLAWPENQVPPSNPGNNPPTSFFPPQRHSAPSSLATLSPDYNNWQNPLIHQPQYDQQQPRRSLLTLKRSFPSAGFQPYVSTSRQAPSQGDIGAAAAFQPNLQLPGEQMQTYPSPHSDVSKDETRSSCFSILPGHDLSPNLMLAVTPSMESHQSPPSAGKRTEEPPRNAEGLITCIHPKCVRDPPVFSRRCEWTKHMDKHTRPYVCNLPGCEKVRGFTYSGGLSRHQREVHRQYGGPKASYMCPHKDCKRSTGSGFSRRENLQEHLRRVHRQVGDAEVEKQVAFKATSPVSTEPKKRRRRIDDNDDEDDNEAELVLQEPRKRRRNDNDTDENDRDSGQNQRMGLSAEIKRLRKELQEKDERLRKLEQTVELLVKRIT